MTMTANENLPIRATRVERIEQKLDREIIQRTGASSAMGGINITSLAELLEVSKLMALSDTAVPKHLRENPGACMAIWIQALEWRMSAWAVANKSYVVNDRISYESQLIHAVIEQRAPLVGRLRCRYTGEGDSRRCVVWASVKGEAEPFEYQSAEFRSIQPKNSPLWKTKPDLQLFYNASRDWARMYFPDVILGVYAEDEIERAAEIPSKSELEKRLDQSTQAEQQPVSKPEEQPPASPQPEEHTGSAGAVPPQSSEAPGASSDSQEPAADEDQTVPELPPVPADQEALVDSVASLCGIELLDSEKRLKVAMVKPWSKLSDQGKAIWWTRFCEGKVPGLVPSLATGAR